MPDGCGGNNKGRGTSVPRLLVGCACPGRSHNLAVMAKKLFSCLLRVRQQPQLLCLQNSPTTSFAYPQRLFVMRRCSAPACLGSASTRAGSAAGNSCGRGFGPALTFSPVIEWLPLRRPPDVACFWLLIFAGEPGRTPFSGAEKPPIAFVCELKEQVHVGLVIGGESQSAISDRASVAHGIFKSHATEKGFKHRKKIGSGQRWRAVPGGPA
jgi:hypothetical protein